MIPMCDCKTCVDETFAEIREEMTMETPAQTLEKMTEIRAEIERVLAEYPISSAGYDPFATTELLSDHHVHKIAVVTEWAKGLQKRKSINRKHTSYGWKHVAERQLWEQVDFCVSNGEVIVALLLAGFKMRVPSDGYPNVYFNIAEKHYTL